MSRLICGCLFQRRDDARVSWRYVVTYRYKNCDVTSWEPHNRLLERAIVNVQAPGDRKKSLSLMAKYNLNINKTSIFGNHFYFLYFFNVNDDYSTFFNGRITFFSSIESIAYRSRNSRLTEWKSGLHIADE